MRATSLLKKTACLHLLFSVCNFKVVPPRVRHSLRGAIPLPGAAVRPVFDVLPLRGKDSRGESSVTDLRPLRGRGERASMYNRPPEPGAPCHNHGCSPGAERTCPNIQRACGAGVVLPLPGPFVRSGLLPSARRMGFFVHSVAPAGQGSRVGTFATNLRPLRGRENPDHQAGPPGRESPGCVGQERVVLVGLNPGGCSRALIDSLPNWLIDTFFSLLTSHVSLLTVQPPTSNISITLHPIMHS